MKDATEIYCQNCDMSFKPSKAIKVYIDNELVYACPHCQAIPKGRKQK